MKQQAAAAMFRADFQRLVEAAYPGDPQKQLEMTTMLERYWKYPHKNRRVRLTNGVRVLIERHGQRLFGTVDSITDNGNESYNIYVVQPRCHDEGPDDS